MPDEVLPLGRTVKNLSVSSLALALVMGAGFLQPAAAQPAANSIKKIVNNGANLNHIAGVDNGWVIYSGVTANAVLRFYTTDADGDLKGGTNVKPHLGKPGPTAGGPFFGAGGVVFAPVPAGHGSAKESEGGVFGIGIGFGEQTFGGAGGSAGGWYNDFKANDHFTNPDEVPGAISAVAVDPTNGAYAVGFDSDNASSVAHGIVIKLESANQTYVPLSQTDLGTLGGSTSQALGISKGAAYVVGIANDAGEVGHAVMASPNATAWTDISAGFPAQINLTGGPATVLKSRALVANDAGFIAGSVTVHPAHGRNTDVGFVYNVNAGTTQFFFVDDADVIPMRVLSDGKVVGNLKFGIGPTAPAGSTAVYHPFFFDGATVTDFGTLTVSGTGQPAYACRVNAVNNLGEAAGSCIANATDTFTNAVRAFYLNAPATGAAFVDLDGAIHTRLNTFVPSIKQYIFSNASAIDDQGEIGLTARKKNDNGINRALYLVSKNAYR